MAEEEDQEVSVTLLTYENDYLREKQQKLQLQYNSLVKQKDTMQNVIDGLVTQRNDLKQRFTLLENQQSELQAKYNVENTNIEKQKDKLLKNYKDKFETNKLNDSPMQEEMQIQCLEDLKQCHIKLLQRNDVLLQKNEELLQCQDFILVIKELGKKEVELVRLETQLAVLNDKYYIDTQMFYLRSALEKFVKENINLSDAQRRGEEWKEYFAQDDEAQKTLQEIGFEGDLQETVINLYYM